MLVLFWLVPYEILYNFRRGSENVSYFTAPPTVQLPTPLRVSRHRHWRFSPKSKEVQSSDRPINMTYKDMRLETHTLGPQSSISIIYNQNKGWFQYINCLMIKTYCLLGHLWSSFLLVITNLHLLKDILTIHNCRSALWFKSLQHGSRITFDFMSHMKSPPSLCKGSAGTFPGCGAGHR